MRVASLLILNTPFALNLSPRNALVCSHDHLTLFLTLVSGLEFIRFDLELVSIRQLFETIRIHINTPNLQKSNSSMFRLYCNKRRYN